MNSMNFYLNFYSGLGIVLLAIFVSLFKWKNLDSGGKVFFISMVSYFLTQFVAQGGLLYKDISKKYWTFYLVVRDLQPILEYTIFVFFFHFAIPELRAEKLATYLVPLGWGTWVLCAILFWTH